MIAPAAGSRTVSLVQRMALSSMMHEKRELMREQGRIPHL